MKLRTLSTIVIMVAVTLAIASFSSLTPPTNAQAISYTVTSTTSLTTSNGSNMVQVTFNSVQLTYASPQTYAFGISASTTPGLWIAQVNWYFGDGISTNLPYCCQTQISDVRNHGYAQPGTYTITVYAFDNEGHFGFATVTVNWITPVPEYSSYTIALSLALLAAPLILSRKRLLPG